MAVLDAMRGFAAVAVAMVHFTIGLKPTWFQSVSHWGWLGVDVFFVISGFIIPHALMRGGYLFPVDYPRFLAKRIIRLHPPYLAAVVLLMIVAKTPATPLQAWIPHTFFSHLFLLNGLLGEPWLTQVFWSLAIEMQFYLFMGVAAPLLTGSRVKMALAVIGFLVVALVPVPKIWLTPHLPLFTFGILAFLKTCSKISLGIFLTGIAFSGVVCAHSLGRPQALAGAATALLICHSNWPVPSHLVKLGAVSYSLYLLHPLVGEVMLPLLDAQHRASVAGQMLVVGISMAISIGAAWIWFRLLEHPSQRLSASIRYAKRN